MSIAASLQATGFADVIIVLKPAKAGLAVGSLPSRIGKLFKRPEFSQDSQLLEALTTKAAAAGLSTGVASLRASAPNAPAVRFYPNLGIALGSVDRTALAALRKDESVGAVLDAPPLRLIKPVAAKAAKAAAGYTWGLRALGVDQLHAQGLSGKGVLVGHLDTGVDGSHPALNGVVTAFAEFDSIGMEVPGAVATDSDNHGTHTAGTIAGQPIKGVRFGVAPGAKLASAMVIEGGNVLARILGGMNWAVGQQVRILSMSLGLPGTERTFLALTKILRARGVLPVFAVGNEGPGTSRYPGNYAEALSVGAVDAAQDVADFSSSQRFKRKTAPIVPDLVGPGVDIVSCVPGGYMQMSGTSMATPHIAGLAALLMEAHPSSTAAQIEAAIFKSCSRKPGQLESRVNRGMPNGPKALSML